jgi:uncharacterized peroxidase-related enzyme
MVDRIVADYATAGLSPKRLAMLRYAEKLTRTPARVSAKDVDLLREQGFSDLDILHIAEVVAYYAYVNRIADGLGVPLEDWIPED